MYKHQGEMKICVEQKMLMHSSLLRVYGVPTMLKQKELSYGDVWLSTDAPYLKTNVSCGWIFMM